MSTVRIVLGPMPGIMRDVLRDAASARIDTRIVAVSERWRDVPAVVRSSRPQAIVACDETAGRSIWTQLLTRHRNLKVLLLADEGRRSRLIRVSTFGSLSPEQILDLAGRLATGRPATSRAASEDAEEGT